METYHNYLFFYCVVFLSCGDFVFEPLLHVVCVAFAVGAFDPRARAQARTQQSHVGHVLIT
jgi:hypothetical protein